jgi:hypothetical protein
MVGQARKGEKGSPGDLRRTGKAHIMHKTSIAALAVAAAPLLVSPAALAAPTGTSHCPSGASGYLSWATSTEPYQADNRVDLNGNGVVCARPTNKTFTEDGVTYTIYNFIDDVLR